MILLPARGPTAAKQIVVADPLTAADLFRNAKRRLSYPNVCPLEEEEDPEWIISIVASHGGRWPSSRWLTNAVPIESVQQHRLQG